MHRKTTTPIAPASQRPTTPSGQSPKRRGTMIAQTEARTRLFPPPSMQRQTRRPIRSLPLAAAGALLLLGLGGCKSHSSNYVTTAQIDNGIDNGSDPALANLAPASAATQVLGANYSYSPQQQSESYPSQSPAPIVSGYNNPDQPYEQAGQSAMPEPDQAPPPGGYPGYGQQPMPGPDQAPPPEGYEGYGQQPMPGPGQAPPPGGYEGYGQQPMPGPDQAPPPGGYEGYGQQPMPGPGEPPPPEGYGEQPIDQTNQPPPPLPEYDQPPCPGPNYLWTPGYWSWGPYGYYWVPGAWFLPPYYGALWTPPYWGFNNGLYGFYPGYWGPFVGFYGGIDYGFGYIGIGFFGGYWNHNHFFYNSQVTNVGRGGYSYRHAVVYNGREYSGRPSNRVSYNGGPGGINVRPRPSEIAASRFARTGALPEQRQAQNLAARNPSQLYANNRGRPALAAQSRALRPSHNIAAMPANVRQQTQRVAQQRARMAPAGQQRFGAQPNTANPRSTQSQRGAAPSPRSTYQIHRGSYQAPRSSYQTQRGISPGQPNYGRAPQQPNSFSQRNSYRAAPTQHYTPAPRPQQNRFSPNQHVQPQRPPAPHINFHPTPSPHAPAGRLR